jgi:hypothetical protein
MCISTPLKALREILRSFVKTQKAEGIKGIFSFAFIFSPGLWASTPEILTSSNIGPCVIHHVFSFPSPVWYTTNAL